MYEKQPKKKTMRTASHRGIPSTKNAAQFCSLSHGLLNPAWFGVILAVVLLSLLSPDFPVIDYALLINIALSVILMASGRYGTRSGLITMLVDASYGLIPLRLIFCVFSTVMVCRIIETSPGGKIGAPSGTVIQAFGNAVTEGTHFLEGLLVLLILILLHFFVISSLRGHSFQSLKAAFMENKERLDVYAAVKRAGDLHFLEALFIALILASGIPGIIHAISHDTVPLFAVLFLGNGILAFLPALLSVTALDMAFSREIAGGARNLHVRLRTGGFYYAAAGMALLGCLKMAEIMSKPEIPYFLIAEIFMITGKFLGTPKNRGTGEDPKIAAKAYPGETVQPPQSAGSGASGLPEKREPEKPDLNKPVSVVRLMEVDPLRVEVGRGLLPLVDPNKGAKLLERVTAIRRAIALELGIVVPGVRFRDDLMLKHYGYVIRLRENVIAEGESIVDGYLAIGPEEKLHSLKGRRTVDPTYGMPGVWITPDQRDNAERLGCMLFDPVGVIGLQLTEVIRTNAAELQGYQETAALVDTVRKTHPAVVRDLIPDQISIGVLCAILKNLLREKVSIRDLVTILETVNMHLAITADPEVLAEFVRVALRRTITSDLRDREGTVWVMTFDDEYEEMIARSIQRTELGTFLSLAPDSGLEILQSLDRCIAKSCEMGRPPIVLTSPQIRAPLRKLTARSFPGLTILSWNEIPANLNVRSLGCVSRHGFEEDEVTLVG